MDDRSWRGGSAAAERAWRWCRRNPTVAGLTALAAALTVSITIVSTVAAWTYKASLSRAEKAEHQARLALGKSLVSEGAALQRTGLIGQRFDSLDRLTRAAQVLGADPEGRKRLPEIRNHAIAALGLTDLRVRRQHDYGDVFEVNVDAALERYAVVEHVRRDRRAPAGRRPRAGPPAGARPSRFLACLSGFSPDGELLVAIYVLGQVGAICCGSGTWDAGSCSAACRTCRTRIFHPDGRHLLFGALEGGIGVWDRVERRVVRRLPLDFTPWSLALDPEGRRLAVSNADAASPRVAILELETGRVLVDWRSQVGNSVLWPGAPMGNCWRSAAARATTASTSGTSAAGRWPRCFRDTPHDHRRPVRALGLPAGDLELGWHDPALGRGLGRAPGDGAG